MTSDGARKIMTDKYTNLQELAQNEKDGIAFHIRSRSMNGAALVVALHGGGIEPGTSEVAEAVAASDLSFYAFEGIKSDDNGTLHITSTRFHEPRLTALLVTSEKVLTIHGEDSQEPVAFLGGRDEAMLARLRDSLQRHGFRAVAHTSVNLQGIDPSNVCNQGTSGAGVQLELSRGLRESFFSMLDARKGRKTRTQRFQDFITAVREAVADSRP